jgi:hypothetical protein
LRNILLNASRTYFFKIKLLSWSTSYEDYIKTITKGMARGHYYPHPFTDSCVGGGRAFFKCPEE